MNAIEITNIHLKTSWNIKFVEITGNFRETVAAMILERNEQNNIGNIINDWVNNDAMPTVVERIAL